MWSRPPLQFGAVFLAGAVLASAITWGVMSSTGATDRIVGDGLSSQVLPTADAATDPSDDEPVDSADDETDDDTETNEPIPPTEGTSSSIPGIGEGRAVAWNELVAPYQRLLGGNALMLTVRVSMPIESRSVGGHGTVRTDDGRFFSLDGAALVDGMPTAVAVAASDPLAGTIAAIEASADQPLEDAVESVLRSLSVAPTGLANRDDELWSALSDVITAGSISDAVRSRSFELLSTLTALEFRVSVADDESPEGSPAVTGRPASVDIVWFAHSDRLPRVVRLDEASGMPVLVGTGPIDRPEDWRLRMDFDARRIGSGDLVRVADDSPPLPDRTAPPSAPPPTAGSSAALDPDGLELRTEDDRALVLPFGATRRDELLFTMTELLGFDAPIERFGLSCGDLTVDSLRWDGLTMTFDGGGRFIGWHVDGASPGLATTGGVRFGSTVADFPVPLAGLLQRVGGRWLYDDGWSSWIFDGDGPDGLLVEFWSGQNCL